MFLSFSILCESYSIKYQTNNVGLLDKYILYVAVFSFQVLIIQVWNVVLFSKRFGSIGKRDKRHSSKKKII